MEGDRADWRIERQMRRSARRGTQGIVGGAVILLIGMLLLLDNMHIVQMREAWSYWPVILIIVGLARVLESRTPSSLVWGGLMACFGALLLLDNLNLVYIDFNYIWPVVLIIFGGMLLWRSIDGRACAPGSSATASTMSVVAIFSGSKRRVTSPDFRGLDALAVFGGMEIDLRGAQIGPEPAVIDVNAMFGGVNIRVPETWAVTVKGMGIFGGFDDKTLPPRTDTQTRVQQLVVSGVSVFGGASVRN